jgi:hypothetical protein
MHHPHPVPAFKHSVIRLGGFGRSRREKFTSFRRETW